MRSAFTNHSKRSDADGVRRGGESDERAADRHGRRRRPDPSHGEEETLTACYRASLAIAEKQKFETVAFPIIAAGSFGFPKDQALHIAIREISNFLLRHDMTVYLVVYDSRIYQIGKKLFRDIAEYIDEHYVQAHYMYNARESTVLLDEADMAPMSAPMASVAPPMSKQKERRGKPLFNFRDLDRELDESFTQMLLRKAETTTCSRSTRRCLPSTRACWARENVASQATKEK